MGLPAERRKPIEPPHDASPIRGEIITLTCAILARIRRIYPELESRREERLSGYPEHGPARTPQG